ncbi:hypothetical protein VTN31DRAFT_2288 [Thermomyces dupontii]|uniref:uncharacterized protein n=1 Tax=Talaromyces thermophilus TaxID=28565 RepID=UPI0037440C32
MNHHLPALPHGQPPIPPPPPQRRQHDMHYANGPPNVRSPSYMTYPPPVNGHVPPAYSQHYPPPWYASYPPVHPPPPGPPPPRPYQPPYAAPLIVSSYPHTPSALAPAHGPPPAYPPQSRSAASTPVQHTLSPTPARQTPNPIDSQAENPPSSVELVASPANAVTSTPQQPKASGWRLPVPFRPPLPWLSVPEAAFPARMPHRRRDGRSLQRSSVSVELPAMETQRREAPQAETPTPEVATEKPAEAQATAPSDPQTPVTSRAPSEAGSTHPTTPSSATPAPAVSRTPTAASTTGAKQQVPLVPVVPIVPASAPRPGSKGGAGKPATPTSTATAQGTSEAAKEETEGTAAEKHTPPRPAPKSWADLVKSKSQPRAPARGPLSTDTGSARTHSESLVDVLQSLPSDVNQYGDKIPFLEPRGLVNTGNMCYMNSVLQILTFCVPFYQFLHYVGRRAAHSFKSDMPLIDATIMFMKEFRVIDAAVSQEQLRLRLKPNELEQFGEAFIPEYVYEVIRQLPRFRDMRRGHQQDAQEFLGFFLEELHEECTRALEKRSQDTGALAESAAVNGDTPAGEGWYEVGHKQKAAITRSSGHISVESPITKIFGGKIRSEFKVPGNKNSVTLEPYQPLQLDIGSPDVHNIVDALKGLTKPETIYGDFASSRGSNATATKQIFIETLPPVLILHLKRFQYDSVTRGTQKIWKKVGYPLELEVPREVFPPHRRNAMALHGGLPRYRLIGVIYHHGKNASGGHYTVDVRRQDGREWIRMDDTVIRRVRSEDVAEAGSEEDPKVLAAALEQHKRDRNSTNIYEQIDTDNDDLLDNDKGWSQVNGTGSSGHASKKSVGHTGANGVSSPAPSGGSPGTRTPLGRYGSRDNRVAYLLFYQRVSP